MININVIFANLQHFLIMILTSTLIALTIIEQ